jgi:hypothetical protein
VGQGLVRSFLAPCLVLTGSLRLTRDVSDVLGSDKPAANALIGAWRAFMQNSVAAHASAGVARKEGLAGAFMSFSLHRAFALTRYCGDWRVFRVRCRRSAVRRSFQSSPTAARPELPHDQGASPRGL